MRTLMTASMLAAFAAALLLATGCEDSPLTAGTDFKIFLSASKTTVYPPPTGEGDTTTIHATVVDGTGVPQKGFVVFFGTDGGEFESSGGVTTDSNGTASNVLHITLTTPPQITVTGTSSSLSGTVKITNGDYCTTGTTNTAAPVADFDAVISTTVHGEVDLTSRSTDTPPGTIAAYAWNCGGGTLTTSGSPGTAICKYPAATSDKTYTISLIVTDDGEGGATQYCQKSSLTKTQQVTITATP
jgi:hypothetical protein